MEIEFVKRWDERKHLLEEYFRTTKQEDYCGSYKTIVEKLFELVINEEDVYDKEFDISNITEIDNGDYQGTLLFIVPIKTYQPDEDDYVVTSVGYGSCSGCDTLQSIHSYDDRTLPTEDQVKEYMTLALHLVQKIKWLYKDNE